MTGPLQEKDLLRRIAQDDATAFRQLFDRYKERFYAAALKMTRSPATAEEIVQEVFVTLWVRRSSLAHVDSPSSYLFTIVYNSIAVHFRKLAQENKMKEGLKIQVKESENPVETKVIEKENQQLLQRILQQLPPQQQLIYELRSEEQLSRNEIARLLDISPNTVKNHLQKATKFIRARFNKMLTVIFPLL